ncbi:MAG TPA: signal peptidase II [Tenericutes bacterium]|jgi:signal peptidase II|nr:signal peptidase II [Mycoplasmatota bacterium]
MKIFYILVVVFVFLDQITKHLVRTLISVGESISIIPNFFSLTSVQNTGAAWGILQDQMILFYIITVAVLVYILDFLYKKKEYSRFTYISLGLLSAGIIGNFIDRILFQAVTDFLDFNIFGYNFPVFNLADSLIIIGLILFTIGTIRKQKREK